jgi:hypothetical protein
MRLQLARPGMHQAAGRARPVLFPNKLAAVHDDVILCHDKVLPSSKPVSRTKDNAVAMIDFEILVRGIIQTYTLQEIYLRL